MCRTNYLGIRGECYEVQPSIFIDDLPGINLVDSTNFTNDMLVRPKDLVNKAYVQAEKEVIADVIGKTSRNYNSIVEDKTFQSAGTYSYKGLENETVEIKIYRKGKDKFLKLHVFDFQILSDRAAEVDFTISDAYGATETLTVNLEIGLNTLAIDEFTKSEYLKIAFSLLDFKVGIAESYDTGCADVCKPCEVALQCGCISVETNKLIGFNMTARCEADECAIIKYLGSVLDLPLLYKSGINFLLEAKLTGRVNAYLRNNEDNINQMLNMLMGGFDESTGTRITSQYWLKVKQAADQVDNLLRKINSVVFTHDGAYITNSTP